MMQYANAVEAFILQLDIGRASSPPPHKNSSSVPA
jgi:hypothetical protein